MVFTNNTGSCPSSKYRSQIETIARAVGLEPSSDQSIESLLQAIYTELLQLRGSIRALQNHVAEIQNILAIRD